MKMRWIRHVTPIAAKEIAYRLLVGTPEGKSLLRRY
jgi:hypothetical protein